MRPAKVDHLCPWNRYKRAVSLRRAFTVTLFLLSCACAGKVRPAEPIAKECPESGDTTIGEYVECYCALDRPFACEVLSLLLLKQGGPEDLARSETLRQKACRLGEETACQRRPGQFR